MDGRLYSKKYRIDWSFLQIYKKLTDVSVQNEENRFGMKKSGHFLHPLCPALRVRPVMHHSEGVKCSSPRAKLGG